jgi:DNA-3-methyladenine glycosylase I
VTRRGARPVGDDIRTYERLCLEEFQAGLSGRTILGKRQGIRRACARFDPATVAAFRDADVDRLLPDPAIARRPKRCAMPCARRAFRLVGPTTVHAAV